MIFTHRIPSLKAISEHSERFPMIDVSRGEVDVHIRRVHPKYTSEVHIRSSEVTYGGNSTGYNNGLNEMAGILLGGRSVNF